MHNKWENNLAVKFVRVYAKWTRYKTIWPNTILNSPKNITMTQKKIIQ